MENKEIMPGVLRQTKGGFQFLDIELFKNTTMPKKIKDYFIEDQQFGIISECFRIENAGNRCLDFKQCLKEGIGKSTYELGIELVCANLNIPRMLHKGEYQFIDFELLRKGASRDYPDFWSELQNKNHPITLWGLNANSFCEIIDKGFENFSNLLVKCQKRFPGCASAAENVIIDIEDFVTISCMPQSPSQVEFYKKELFSHLRELRLTLAAAGNVVPHGTFIKEGRRDKKISDEENLAVIDLWDKFSSHELDDVIEKETGTLSYNIKHTYKGFLDHCKNFKIMTHEKGEPVAKTIDELNLTIGHLYAICHARSVKKSNAKEASKEKSKRNQ